MKAVDKPDVEIGRRAKFEYDPNRHYVLVQKPDNNWDGAQFDRLMDQTDKHGEDAYRIELDGASGPQDRLVTGHRQMVMMSCDIAHITEKIREAAAISKESSHKIAPTSVNHDVDTFESLQFRSAISVDDIPNKA